MRSQAGQAMDEEQQRLEPASTETTASTRGKRKASTTARARHTAGGVYVAVTHLESSEVEPTDETTHTFLQTLTSLPHLLILCIEI